MQHRFSRRVSVTIVGTGQFTYRRVDTGQLQTVNLLSLGTRPIDSTVMNFYNSLVPSPNTDAGCSRGDGINIRCFAWNVPSKGQTNRYTARIDHQLTDSHSVEFVYNQANFLTFNDVLNGIEQIFPKSNPGAQESKRQVFTWALHSVFGSTKTNTARFGLTRAPVGFNIKDDYSALGGFQLTTPGVLSDPTFTSANIPQGRNTLVRQVSDDFGELVLL